MGPWSTSPDPKSFCLHFSSITLPAFTKSETLKPLLYKPNSKPQCSFSLFPLQPLRTFSFIFVWSKRWIFSHLFSHRNRIKTLSPSIITLIRLLKSQIASISSKSRSYGIWFHYVSSICKSRISSLFWNSEYIYLRIVLLRFICCII